MVFHDTTLMFTLALSAAVGSLVLFTITHMKVNAAGTKLWAAGFACLSVAYGVNFILPELSQTYLSFFFNAMLLSGHALILAGTWHYVGYLLPTSKMAMFFIPIVIITFVFTFIYPDREIRILTIGIWLISVRTLYAWVLWNRTNKETYERHVAMIAVLMAGIEVVCTSIYTYHGAIGNIALMGQQSDSIAVVAWIGALVGIMVGAPLLMLLSTSRFISDLDKAAHVDPLTGLLNRRGFYESAKRLFSLRDRQNLNVGVLMLDVDWFKKVNDTFGHMVGDVILEKLGIVLKSEMRDTDLASRWGGEEFCILAYDISEYELEKLANRVRFKFTDECAKYKKLNGNKITISIGVACSNSVVRDFEELQKHADEALYDAKHVTGKDCVKFYTSPNLAV